MLRSSVTSFCTSAVASCMGVVDNVASSFSGASTSMFALVSSCAADVDEAKTGESVVISGTGISFVGLFSSDFLRLGSMRFDGVSTFSGV